MKTLVVLVGSLALISAATSTPPPASHTSTTPLPREFQLYSNVRSMVQHIVINSWSGQEFAGKTKVDIYFDRAIGFHIAIEETAKSSSDIKHIWKGASGCHAGRWTQYQGVAQQLEYQDTPDCAALLSNPTDFNYMLLKVLLNLQVPMLSDCKQSAIITQCTLPDKRLLGLMFKNGYLWRAVLSIDGQRNVSAAEFEPPTLRKIYPNELRFDAKSLNVVPAMTGSATETDAVWKAAIGGSRTALVIAMASLEMQQTPSDMSNEQVLNVLKRAYEAKIPKADYFLSRMYTKGGQAYLPDAERSVSPKQLRVQLEKYTIEAMRACNHDAIQLLQQGCFEAGCDGGAEQPKREIAFEAFRQEQQCKLEPARAANVGARPDWARTDFGTKSNTQNFQ